MDISPLGLVHNTTKVKLLTGYRLYLVCLKISLGMVYNNFEKHEKYTNNINSEKQEEVADHVILDRDPLSSVFVRLE